MKSIICMVLVALWLGGCAVVNQGKTQGKTQDRASFTWYHPQGGEYLFTFDRKQCQARVESAGHRLGIDPRGPFFQCMQRRGYALLGADGQLLSQTDPELPVSDVSYQSQAGG